MRGDPGSQEVMEIISPEEIQGSGGRSGNETSASIRGMTVRGQEVWETSASRYDKQGSGDQGDISLREDKDHPHGVRESGHEPRGKTERGQGFEET